MCWWRFPGSRWSDHQSALWRDISVRLATGDPAEEIISDVLRRALGLPEAPRPFRRIPQPATRGRSRGPEGPSRLERHPPPEGGQPPRRSPGSPSPLRDPSASPGQVLREEFPAFLYADAPRPGTGNRSGAGHRAVAHGRPVPGHGPGRRDLQPAGAHWPVGGGRRAQVLRRPGRRAGCAHRRARARAAGAGRERQTLRVPKAGIRAGDVRAAGRLAGALQISITAWRNGSYLGELLAEVTAVRGPPASHKGCRPS